MLLACFRSRRILVELCGKVKVIFSNRPGGQKTTIIFQLQRLKTIGVHSLPILFFSVIPLHIEKQCTGKSGFAIIFTTDRDQFKLKMMNKTKKLEDATYVLLIFT